MSPTASRRSEATFRNEEFRPGRIYKNKNLHKFMGYFELIDDWLSAVLPPNEDDEDEEQWLIRVKKEVKAKILESYRNGQKAEPQPDTSDRDGRPRVSGARKFRPRWKRDGHQ